jgi:hypothetical protein
VEWKGIYGVDISTVTTNQVSAECRGLMFRYYIFGSFDAMLTFSICSCRFSTLKATTLFLLERYKRYDSVGTKKTYSTRHGNPIKRTMKQVLLASLLLASADAFAVTKHATFGTVTSLKMSASIDASKSAIDEALSASKEFGATSKEARVA